MKCRLAFAGELKPGPGAGGAGRKGPVRDPFEIDRGSTPTRETGPVPLDAPPIGSRETEPVREEPKLGSGEFDEPPDWAKKPELAAPPPDLDDAFDGGLDLGGYEIDDAAGAAPGRGPAVSDAFQVMTGSSIMGGSDEPGGKKRRRKSRARGPEPSPMGGVDGLPPDLDPFGLVDTSSPSDVFAARQAEPQTRKRRSLSKPKSARKPSKPLPVRPAPKRRDAPGTPGQPPAAYSPPGPAAPQMRAPDRPTYQGPPPVQAAPLGAPLGEGAGPAPIKRPVPRDVASHAAPPGAPKPARARPSMPKIDWSFLARAKLLVRPKAIVGELGAVLVVVALGYLLFGGNYFSSQAQMIAGGAQTAMAGAASYHVQAEVLMQTEKAGTIQKAVSADIVKDKDLHAVYGAARLIPSAEYVTVGAKTYARNGAGAWSLSTDLSNPDFSSMSIFAGASGIRVIDKQVMEGVECDHLGFDSKPTFALSLFPGVSSTPSTSVHTEIWVDPQQKYIKHVRLDASDLETGKLGKFNCHVEASISGYNAPVQIAPPM
jgi:hypothetical protein